FHSALFHQSLFHVLQSGEAGCQAADRHDRVWWISASWGKIEAVVIDLGYFIAEMHLVIQSELDEVELAVLLGIINASFTYIVGHDGVLIS
ncbi:MAG: hypothetical protein D3922_15020, partial [Candidatus Electrothrix sp. AR1]|nr:hypothetical protein [Candidatus Electrothrix sp. AR1]